MIRHQYWPLSLPTPPYTYVSSHLSTHLRVSQALLRQRQPLAAVNQSQWRGSGGQAKVSLSVSMDTQQGLEVSPHKCPHGKWLSNKGTSQRGGARSASEGPEKRRFGTPLCNSLSIFFLFFTFFSFTTTLKYILWNHFYAINVWGLMNIWNFMKGLRSWRVQGPPIRVYIYFKIIELSLLKYWRIKSVGCIHQFVYTFFFL